MARRGRPGGAKRYDRTVRVGELLREILGDELIEIDDDELTNVSFTSVDVDADLQRGIVYFDALDEDDTVVAEALDGHRIALQRAIATQARIRRTPTLVFRPDPAVSEGLRIDAVLRDIEQQETAGGDAEQPAADDVASGESGDEESGGEGS
jgi:ribosome-binding factor A